MRRLKKELWPVMITVDRPEIIYDIEIWLGETLGAVTHRWNVVYKHNATDFYFKNQEDATMFALRWA